MNNFKNKLDGGDLRETTSWLATWAGPTAVVLTFGVVLAAALTTNWFSWTSNALFDLGYPRVARSWLFNLGLVTGGLLGTVFATRVIAWATTPAHRLGGATFALAAVSFATIGVFHADTALHGVVTVGFLVTLVVALLLSAAGDFRTGAVRSGVGTAWLATMALTGWAVWAVIPVLDGGQQPGVAIPQFLGLLAFAGYVTLSTARIRRDGPTAATDSDDGGTENPEPV